jgi:hypothetical protein
MTNKGFGRLYIDCYFALRQATAKTKYRGSLHCGGKSAAFGRDDVSLGDAKAGDREQF